MDDEASRRWRHRSRLALWSFLSAPLAVTAVFVAGRLLGELAWSWWWILSPLWLALAGAVCAAPVVFLVMWLVVRVGNRIP